MDKCGNTTMPTGVSSQRKKRNIADCVGALVDHTESRHPPKCFHGAFCSSTSCYVTQSSGSGVHTLPRRNETALPVAFSFPGMFYVDSAVLTALLASCNYPQFTDSPLTDCRWRLLAWAFLCMCLGVSGRHLPWNKCTPRNTATVGF